MFSTSYQSPSANTVSNSKDTKNLMNGTKKIKNCMFQILYVILKLQMNKGWKTIWKSFGFFYDDGGFDDV